MSDPSVSYVICENCGKRFKWRPEIAGKKAMCPCGMKFVVPLDPPAAAPPILAVPPPPAAPAPCAAPAPVIDLADPYDLADDPAPIPSTPPITPVPFKAPSQVQNPRPPRGLPSRGKPQVEPADAGARKADLIKFGMIAAIVVVVLGGAVFGFRVINKMMADRTPQSPDDQIDQQIKDGDEKEVVAWLDENPRHILFGMTSETGKRRAQRLYDLGAKKVLATGEGMCMTLIVELPPDKAQRDPLFDWIHNFEAPPDKPLKDTGQKYVIMGLPAV